MLPLETRNTTFSLTKSRRVGKKWEEKERNELASLDRLKNAIYKWMRKEYFGRKLKQECQGHREFWSPRLLGLLMESYRCIIKTQPHTRIIFQVILPWVVYLQSSPSTRTVCLDICRVVVSFPTVSTRWHAMSTGCQQGEKPTCPTGLTLSFISRGHDDVFRPLIRRTVWLLKWSVVEYELCFLPFIVCAVVPCLIRGSWFGTMVTNRRLDWMVIWWGVEERWQRDSWTSIKGPAYEVNDGGRWGIDDCGQWLFRYYWPVGGLESSAY